MWSKSRNPASRWANPAQGVKRLCATGALSAVVCFPGVGAHAQATAQLQASTSVPANPNSNTNIAPSIPGTNVDQVSIDLVARDKKKRPVLNLTPAEIAVTDAGKPVQLAGLHLVKEESGAPTLNLLFDRMDPASARIARDVAAKLLSMAPAQSSFAVLGVDRGLRLFQNFTQDRDAIKAATALAMKDLPGQALTEAENQLNSITRIGAYSSGTNASVEDRARAHIMLSALEETQRAIQDERARTPLAAMEALAKAQQSLSGRKIIVFFSTGMTDDINAEKMTKEVVEAANRAGITIYTIDTSGVSTKSFDVLTMMYAPDRTVGATYSPTLFTGNLPTVTAGKIAVMGAGGISDAYSPSEYHGRNSEDSVLATLAEATGGFSMSAAGNVRENLKHLIGDISTYYQAHYAPDLKDYDGRFHSIDITSLRQGVTIRSGAGYFALPPDVAGSFIVRPFEAPLLKILSGSPSPADVPFLQSVLRLGSSSSRTTDELVIEVPVSHLELRQDQRTLLYSVHVSILAQIRDKAGVVVQRFSQDIAPHGALENIDAARAGFITMQRSFTAVPGNYVLEAAVLDGVAEKSSVQRFEFTISASTDGPSLSDIALVRRTEPLNGMPNPLDPMQYAGERVVPNLSRQLPDGAQRVSFFFGIRPDARHPEQGGTLDMDVQRDGKSVSRSSTVIPPSAGSDSTLNLATIQAAKLGPGSYRAIFTFAQGEEHVSRDLEFTLVKTGIDPADNQPEPAVTTRSEAEAVPSELIDLAPSRFTPTSKTSPAPVKKYQDALLAGARKRALGYVKSLVNFKCIEITDRFIDQKSIGNWEPHDKIAEIVTFENQQEARQVLEVNGRPGNAEPIDMKGARLEGEFGGVLKAVFDPSSQAEFAWKETDSLDEGSAQVFSYRVDAKHSQFSVVALPNTSVVVAFHGLVYIDDATRGVRRITMVADGIPAHWPVHASAIDIDYDYVNIDNHDYLMPVQGQLQMKVGKQEAILHRIQFRDYHRFGSNARILGVSSQ